MRHMEAASDARALTRRSKEVLNLSRTAQVVGSLDDSPLACVMADNTFSTELHTVSVLSASRVSWYVTGGVTTSGCIALSTRSKAAIKTSREAEDLPTEERGTNSYAHTHTHTKTKGL